jgi:hypothetical protein
MQEQRTVRQQSPCLVYLRCKKRKANTKERKKKEKERKERKRFVVTATLPVLMGSYD